MGEKKKGGFLKVAAVVVIVAIAVTIAEASFGNSAQIDVAGRAGNDYRAEFVRL